MSAERRLIEEALPLAAVNAASAREKSIRHGNISTMHLWWARRPLSMSRAVVFATLLPDPRDDAERVQVLAEIAEAAPFEASVKDALLNPLRKRLAAAYPERPPTVLDCFAGGGAIPLEALRLGCEVTALDLNPVAFLIEKCVLEYPQRFGQPGPAGENPLAEEFVHWAGWVRDRVAPRLVEVFPTDQHGRRPAVYFWARTMICANPACRVEIPLLTSYWLAHNERHTVWVEPIAEAGHIALRVQVGSPPKGFDPDVGTVKASSVTCPVCGSSLAAKGVREYAQRVGLGERLYAVLDINRGKRSYREPRTDEAEGPGIAADRLTQLEQLSDGTTPIPDERITKSQFRILRSLVYGIDTFRGLFNDRQLFVLGTLCETVRAAHAEMLAGGMDPERALAVSTYLGLCVDRISDYNCGFTSWVPGGEFDGHVFKRQAIAMIWDYVEIDPLADISGDWEGAVRWIELAVRHCSTTGTLAAAVKRADAQQLPFADAAFDAVVIDPPYYDAIQYGDLSDFFYVWLKRSVGELYPELFSTPLTPKTQEVIESRADRKSPEYISHEEFEIRLGRALAEVARVVKPEGLVSLVFAHTDVEAWERLLRVLRTVGLVVTTSWPMRSEREARSTAQISAVLGSSVVLVCRPQRPEDEGFYDDVVRELESRIAERLDAFESMGLVGADYFISAVGPAFEVFARYARVVRLSGEEVDVSDLMVLARQTVARHAMRRLLATESLTALDSTSLFYLTWRWAYRTVAIPADEAQKLEKAFDVDLEALGGPNGLVEQKGSTFSLRGPQERPKIILTASPSLVDVLHLSCRLWDAGRRRELEELLGATGVGNEPGFWSMARAIAELLPDGEKERMMLLGITGNRDALATAAAKATVTVDDLRLFDQERR